MKLAKQPKFTAKKKKLKKLPLGEKINEKKLQSKDDIQINNQHPAEVKHPVDAKL